MVVYVMSKFYENLTASLC